MTFYKGRGAIGFGAESTWRRYSMTDRSKPRSGYLFEGFCDGEPVLISACLLGIPCRWHGRRPKKREKLIERLKKRYVLVPVCPEHLGGKARK